MTFNDLVNEIAKKEGKKSPTEIGNIREIVRIMSEIIVKKPEALAVLLNNGLKKKAKKKATKKP